MGENVKESPSVRKHGRNKIPVNWQDEKAEAEGAKHLNEEIGTKCTKCSHACKIQTMI
jgi:hypothetical protein